MNKKGFTLVELLAVIIILGLIGIIVVPTINKTIENQRKKAFQTSVLGLAETAKKEAQADGFIDMKFTFDENKLCVLENGSASAACVKEIETNGEITNGFGVIEYYSDGSYSLAIGNKKYCALKYKEENSINYSNSETCILELD